MFLTGATGYVGRRVLERVLDDPEARVTVLVRSAERLAPAARRDPRVRVVPGDLAQPASFASEIEPGAVVIHAAALTGKADRPGHFAANAEGTRAVVDAAVAAGASRFVHVSTVAVRFADRPAYHYADAKEEAEEIVRASGLPWVVVRPTMVAGPESPVVSGLARLALLPVTPVFGDGKVEVQPIFVDDLAALLVDAAVSGGVVHETIDAGGPEAVSIEELLRRIRARRGAGPARCVHLPLRPIRWLLAAVEPLLLPVLPLTAGQLATFANPGTAVPHPFVDDRRAGMRTLDEMLEDAPPREGPGVPIELSAECRRLSRYLVGEEPTAYVIERYARFEGRPEAVRQGVGGDRWILAFARWGRAPLRIADAYTARFARESALRRKLVLALALLESTPPSSDLIDGVRGGGVVAAYARLTLRGVLEAGSLILGLLLIGPPDLVLRALSGSDRGAAS